jgi:hypothetical protein
MKKAFGHSVMNRISRHTAIFLKAPHGTTYIVPFGMDLPKRTCKKYGVTLKTSVRKNLQIQLVTVLTK